MSIYFVNTNNVYTSYSSWVISYIFYLEPYESHMQEVKMSVSKCIESVLLSKQKLGGIAENMPGQLQRQV